MKPSDRQRRPDREQSGSEFVLEASGLVREFSTGSALRPSKVSAVDGVSLQLRAGEVLGVVGESGCGKSTLARMLVGLDRPDQGTLHYRGTDVTAGRRNHRRLLRRSVQMIFQDPFTSLDPRMTVLDIVGEPLAASGTMRNTARRRERVADLLHQVGLTAEMMPRFPHQFSGGQRQRIGIARALALQPDVLICDEPVSALDVSVQAQVINLLGEIQRDLGMAILFIAHDLSVVRHIADQVAVMYLGRIAEIGSTDLIYQTPAHPYTKALLSASPSVDPVDRGRLTKRHILGGEPPSPVSPPDGCRFNPRCWMASKECTTVIPTLRQPDHEQSSGRLTACHHADELLRSPTRQ